MAQKAVLFDLDGTILNTLDDLADAVNFALADRGYPTRTREEVRRFVGNGVESLMRQAVPAGTPDVRMYEALAVFRADYERRKENRTCPYAGVPELLATLKKEGILIGVVSNKYDAAVRALCEHYFPGLVDLALGERAGVPRKPAPDALFYAMETLGVCADACVYVGDSEGDVVTAKNAGLSCISVLWGFRDRADMEAVGGRVFARSVDELLALLRDFFSPAA